MLDWEHREVLRVSGARPRPTLCGGSRDQAVGLPQGDASRGELASPRARGPGNRLVDGQHDQPGDQSVQGVVFRRPETSHDLLDVDGGRRGNVSELPQRGHSSHRGAAAKEVDQHRRVEDSQQGSTRPAGVAAALVANPPTRVAVPLVSRVGPRRPLLRTLATGLLVGPVDGLADRRIGPGRVLRPGWPAHRRLDVHTHVRSDRCGASTTTSRRVSSRSALRTPGRTRSPGPPEHSGRPRRSWPPTRAPPRERTPR